ncbi:MAG: CpaF family protein [Planctomycetes bacterium]|nr:CpaF family protein [Planctomycetota bacterium]
MVENAKPAAAELIDPSTIFAKTLRSFFAPVQQYMDDPSVVEVMINGPDEVYIEQRGQLIRTDAKFVSEEALVAGIRNLLQYVGKRLTEDHPMIDARLPDGSRVHVAMPPCSRKGACITIRKFKKEGFDFAHMVQCGTLSQMAMDYLRISIQCEKNLVFAGGTSSGKTTLLNTLGNFVPEHERIVVIEESSELQLRLPHVLQLETRGPDRYGRGEVTIRELFRNSLRMRPDRIIVGEVRGGEALDLIQALTSGHGGSMSTMHADTPIDALNRIETMALMSDVAIPLNALRTQIASSIDVVVQMSRFRDASRRVVQISEVLPVDENYQYRLNDVFMLTLPEGSRKLEEGTLEWTGCRPAMMDEVQGRVMAQETESLAPFFADKGS